MEELERLLQLKKEGSEKVEFALGEYYESKGDMEKAVACYKKYSDYGYLNAVEKVGAAYRFGIGVEKNFEKAKQYYNKMRDDSTSEILINQVNYISAVEKDMHTEKSRALTDRFFSEFIDIDMRSAEGDNHDAYSQFIWALVNMNLPSERYQKRGERVMRRLNNSGFALANIFLYKDASKYMHDWVRDLDDSVENFESDLFRNVQESQGDAKVAHLANTVLFERSAFKDYNRGSYDMVRQSFDGTRSHKVLDVMGEMAKKGSPYAQMAYATLVIRSETVDQEVFQQALSYMEALAEKNDVDAYRILFEYYTMGYKDFYGMYDGSSERNLVKAEYYSRLLLERNLLDEEFRNRLESLYREAIQGEDFYVGWGVPPEKATPEELEVSLNYFLKQADEGDIEAKYLLAGYYCNAYGNCPDIDLEKAEEYIRQSVAKNLYDASGNVRSVFAHYLSLIDDSLLDEDLSSLDDLLLEEE